MRAENIEKSEAQSSKMKIPREIQKDMLEFFIHTSIPRKKAKENHLPNFSQKETDK